VNTITLQSLDLLLRTLPQGKTELLVAALEQGQLHSLSPSVAVANLLNITGHAAGAVVRFLRSEPDIRVLHTALSAGSYLVTTRDTEKVELVWTGPVDLTVPARATSEVLCEMAGNACQSIDIVGYSLTSGCESVIEALVRARRRGVTRMRIIANQLDRKIHVLNSLWPGDTEKPDYYTRPKSSTDPMASLHAKLMLVDDRELLVTSANLTYHGLNSNVEIGLRVTGKTCQRVAELLSSLINHDIVRKIEIPGE